MVVVVVVVVEVIVFISRTLQRTRKRYHYADCTISVALKLGFSQYIQNNRAVLWVYFCVYSKMALTVLATFICYLRCRAVTDTSTIVHSTLEKTNVRQR